MLASELARSIELDELVRAEGNPCLVAFSESLARDPRSTIEGFLYERPLDDRSNLPALIAIELQHKLSRGIPDSVESYLRRFPELSADRGQVLDLIYAEYCERRQLQLPVESEDYYRRFPEFQDSLERLFRIDSLLGGDDADLHAGLNRAGLATLNLPTQGDRFLDFHLIAELGEGTFGRVFLAEQMTLSDRLVVVKITSQRTIEHQTLARLRHPNIVPVLSVHQDDLTGLQAVCMPHQGAVALSAVRSLWKDRPELPLKADVFLESLERLTPPDSRKLESDSNSPPFPGRDNFVYACCWLFHRLALALAHAHARGILHRDIKPSNILLSASGQPLLVDFNLAFNQFESKGNHAAFFGGTLPYMPPEQLEALHPAERGSPDQVDPRSDIYGLAATFFELLTGQLPFGEPPKVRDLLPVLRDQLDRRQSVPSARALNPRVPRDLNALITKCLNPQSDHRYETAAELAHDLQRFLENRSLHHIGKVPRREVALKFAQRNWPRLIAGAVGLSIVFVMLALGYKARIANFEAQIANDKATIAAIEAKSAKIEAENANTNLVLEQTNALNRFKRDFEALWLTIKDLPREKQANEVFLMGWRYKDSSLFRPALLAFSKAIELGYNEAQVFKFRGDCHAFLDEDGAAIAEFDHAIQLKPDYGHCYKSRAIALASSEKGFRNPDKAIKDIELALKYPPPDEDPVASSYYLDVARVYAAASRGPTESRAAELLELGEKYLLRAADLGHKPQSILIVNEGDRFRMLGPLLARTKVRERLQLDKKK